MVHGFALVRSPPRSYAGDAVARRPCGAFAAAIGKRGGSAITLRGTLVCVVYGCTNACVFIKQLLLLLYANTFVPPFHTVFTNPGKIVQSVVLSRCDTARRRGRESGRRRSASMLGRRFITLHPVHVLRARRCSEVYIMHGDRRKALRLQVLPGPRGKICAALLPPQPTHPSRMYVLWTGARWLEKYLYFYYLSRHKFNIRRGSGDSSTQQCRAAKGWSVGF